MNCSNIFDWLKHINQYKTPTKSFSDKDWEVFNSYMVHRFLSMNPDYFNIVFISFLFNPISVNI